ncbi:MAG: DUF2189 domain-containing protein [Rhodovibrionaceae bacterium]|nr:DUF2189 domain-containing protein [Rhodovibrionaceae bacterium]
MSEAVSSFGDSVPKVRQIGLDRPWVWLACGWQDLARQPAVSLSYGLIFALAGLIIAGAIWLVDLFYLVLPLSAGFILLGPIVAVGLYEVSRRQGRGETASLGDAFSAFRVNAAQLGLMGLALMLFLLAWIQLALLIFMLFFSHAPPRLDNFVADVFFSAQSIPFLIVGCGIGAVLAAAVFSISVVAVPMLLDRPETNVFTAIATSVAAVRENPKPLAVWAALIVLFTGAGLITFYVGLVIMLPLIGHATWYAYKDLVGYES